MALPLNIAVVKMAVVNVVRTTTYRNMAKDNFVLTSCILEDKFGENIGCHLFRFAKKNESFLQIKKLENLNRIRYLIIRTFFLFVATVNGRRLYLSQKVSFLVVYYFTCCF